jgi:hypothetical protein
MSTIGLTFYAITNGSFHRGEARIMGVFLTGAAASVSVTPLGIATMIPLFVDMVVLRIETSPLCNRFGHSVALGLIVVVSFLFFLSLCSLRPR